MLNVECMYDVETLRSLNGNKMVRNETQTSHSAHVQPKSRSSVITYRAVVIG